MITLKQAAPCATMLAAVALAVGCADDDDGGTAVTTPAEEAAVSAAYDAVAMDAAMYDPYYYGGYDDGFWYLAPALDLAAVADRPAGSLPAPLASLLRGWGATFGTGCVQYLEGEDADGDGVPARFDATFSCAGDVLGRAVSVTGDVRVTDEDDSVRFAGHAMRFTAFTVSVTQPDGEKRTRMLDGTATLDTQGAIVASQKLTQHVIVEGAVPYQATIGIDTTSSYVPALEVAGVEPFARGTVTLEGELTIAIDGETFRTTRRTEPSLSWNRACREAVPPGSGFDGGRLIVDSERRDFELAFSCSATTLTRR